MKFYSTMASVWCGNGCNAKMQVNTYDENGNPVDMDWVELQRIYNDHNASCSPQNLFTNHSEAFYGDPNDCYVEPGYCEY